MVFLELTNLTQGTKEWAVCNVNFSKGCSHGCLYCYAKRIGDRFGWKRSSDWVNMENKPEMKKKTFQRRAGWIMSPSSHDITSRNIDLSLIVFSNILKPGNNLLIVSKPSLAITKRLCTELSQWKGQIKFRFTIGTLNDNIRRYWEPFAPSITQRLKSLQYAFNNGWQTSVSIEPFLDSNLLTTVNSIDPFVSDTIWIGPMNKVHVPKELWTNELTLLYSPQSLLALMKQLNTIHNPKICYKDHFLDLIQQGKKNFKSPKSNAPKPLPRVIPRGTY